MSFESKRGYPYRQPDRPPLLIGSVWMAGISLVLSLVPLVGAFAGGLVGGWLVGSAKRGLGAAAIGAVIYALILPWIPYAGIFRTAPGLERGTTIALSAAAMIIGGVCGGALSRTRGERRTPA